MVIVKEIVLVHVEEDVVMDVLVAVQEEICLLDISRRWIQ